jgi:hypothetical protein
MAVFLCRWHNGDFSVVKATNKDEAIELLDEIANAEECSVTARKDFMARFRLNDEGEFELEGVGEDTESLVLRRAYPILDKAIMENGNIGEALEKERARLWPKEGARRKAQQPQTQLGRDLKARTDAPTKMLGRIISKEATKSLTKFRGKGSRIRRPVTQIGNSSTLGTAVPS